jgi:hypothetical protein
MLEVNRRLEYADRTAIQQSDQTIKRNVVRALIELITNVDDSYRSIEQRDKVPVDGTIRVSVQRRHKNSLLKVADRAEGISPERLDQCVGTYSGFTSGAKEGLVVRGYFGRGLKEAMLGLGKGAVYSVCDNKFSKCSIEVEGGVPRYKREKPRRASRTIRAQFDVPTGNGSIVEVTITRSGVRIPQIQNLRTSLERNYALRDILSNPKRRVVLVEVDQKGRERNEYELQYRYPAAESLLQTTGGVPGFQGATFDIEVFRSSEPLESPATDKESADGGFLIKSPRAVLDLTLFKYEYDSAAERLFGRVNCGYLDTLLEADETIVKADRTGIDWSHDFAKALKKAVEAVLEPVVEKERQRAKQSQQAAVSRELRNKIDSALEQLNKIAQLELGTVGPDVEDDIPYIPEGGFGFVPPYAHIVIGKQSLLSLRAVKDRPLKAGSIVNVTADNQMVLVHTEQVVLADDPNREGVLSARVLLEGRQVGAEAVITAAANDSQAEAFVKVIAKREPTPPPDEPPQRKAGLFDGIRFDEQAEPRQRVRLENRIIIVAVKAPSVSSYLGAGGVGTDTPQGQVMLAELVSEAFCRELAREGVGRGKFISAPGAEADAKQREYLRLHNQYAAKIHEQLVDPQYRGSDSSRKMGRPPREVTLSRSTLPA